MGLLEGVQEVHLTREDESTHATLSVIKPEMDFCFLRMQRW